MHRLAVANQEWLSENGSTFVVPSAIDEAVAGVSAIATASSDQEPSARLKTIYDQMAKATSTDVLDEIYVRAEGDLDGPELEALMREYRTCKAAIGRLI